tara:strand:+ start:129 stop:623 length:495 start_codon:yes stop_codon:yes gene_type:complete
MGLMGSGKSIIGKDLGKYLKLKFYDTDKQIELEAKKSINAIFEEDGETYFRDIEEKICIELLEHNNCVISLGGGSIINSRIRKAIIQNSYSIYLKVKLDNILNRIKTLHKRPLLNKKLNKREILQNLYYNRKKFYEKADLIVKNDNDKFIALEKIKSELKSYAK